MAQAWLMTRRLHRGMSWVSGSLLVAWLTFGWWEELSVSRARNGKNTIPGMCTERGIDSTGRDFADLACRAPGALGV